MAAERPRLRARLVARDLSVRYLTRRAEALREVSLRLAAGDRVLVAGPSGAGKSTLGLCLAGLIPTSVDADVSGVVEVDGWPTTAYPPGDLAAHVGMVFQDPSSQFTMLRVDEEVAFGLENLGVPADAMPERVAAALAAVGLADRAGWALERLSGGQQQRVAIAAALATQPGTLILDEPTAHLDPAAAQGVYAAVRSLADDLGTTLVVVEHALDHVVPDLVARCILLGPGGSLLADGAIPAVLGEADAARRWAALGTWLPSATRLALALGAADPLPLNVDEAARWLARDPAAQARLRRSGGETPTTPGPIALHAEGVRQRYRSLAGEHLGLRGVDLAVREGEMVAVVGASGSGKTTLLRALSGLLPLDGGRVTVDGQDLARVDARHAARLVSHVFQNPESGFVADTVEDEVAYGPRALGWPEAEVGRHVRASLEQFGLVALARANPYTLSQGQKRRLSVAASLVLRPRVLVLDEPTFGQDRQSAETLMVEIGALRRHHLAVLVATHDLGLVVEEADRVLALVNGAVVFDGSPGSFLASPAALAAAGQEVPALPRILQRALQLGADVPPFRRWADLAAATPAAAVSGL